ncbi:hypothetical protein EDD21DRAFT_131196 [Dissophora ornata]|nr:hypothetical protein EDD21DRAFT_131196 [Dissophora ornata]
MSPRKPSQQQPLPGNRGQQNNRHPLLLPTTSSAQPSDGGAPSPPLSWYASISAMSLSPSTLSGSTCLPSPPPSMQPAPASSGLSPTIIFSRTVLHESTPQVIDNSAISTRSSPPTAHPPARRAQSIPISFLVNPTPQSPRPFSFPDLWSPPPSPPPVSGISPSLSLASTSIQGEHPNRQYPSDHSLATTCFATTTETATTSLNDPSPSNDISGSPLSSTVNTLDIRRVNTNERAFTASFNQSSQIHQLLSSSSASTATHGASVIFDQRPAPSTTRSYIIDAQDTPNTGAPPVRQVSLRRTMNPDVKTTKTGKIQHRSKRIGTNRKSTAYNRFLLQRSRFYAKHFPDQTPQQVKKEEQKRENPLCAQLFLYLFI